ncbi:hypothetical protein FRC11_003332 [Ceratobasidium sp. 423]|nr:hypothetical protein FRC11_003332 [Ceratobasidium sp. 423]
MGDPTPINGQTERAASLSQAAESLARAAAKLSEAARAMSLVAGALSKGSLAKSSGTKELDGKSSPPGGSDTPPSSDAATAEDEGVGLPQPYRLLLDDEAEVLLVLCSLVYDLPKVVCYFACGAPSLKVYKSLIDGVAETKAIIPDPPGESTVNLCFDKFLKERRSIILLSETDIPSAQAKEASEYAVIHVGWPANKGQYVAQRRAHHASTNIMLACSGDKDIYPSGSAIMSQTIAWPGDTGGFRASVDILRPLFEERLSEVSFEMKEEVYLDWLHLHSSQGSRSVSSWTPGELVNRANRFILGPLAYRSPGSLAQRSTLQTPLADLLPEVSAEFVTQHGLQPAVDEGLLRVETDAVVEDTHEPNSNSADRSAEDTRSRIAEVHLSQPLKDRNPAEGTGSVQPTPDAAERTTPDDKGDENQGPDLGFDIGEGSEYQTEILSTNTTTTKPLTQDPVDSEDPKQSYRLLVDTEADVLLFVTLSLRTYKLMIENVAEIPVDILDPSTPEEQGQAYTNFLENPGSILLVPETLLPELDIKGEGSWVIHVGWPASGAQYIAQTRAHRAQNNILVAYTGDQSVYPSGDSIIKLTEPWPKDGASFRASVSILRSLYEVMLSVISLEMKTRVYLDWIQLHGIHGPRHVEAWTPSIVIQRANAYLLEGLRWNGEHTGGDIPLPEVSREFVTQNNLESAVLEGILEVEDPDSDPSAPSLSPAPRPDPVPLRVEFQPTNGHTYFALNEEFDAIPLMCFISGKYDKVICFLEGQLSLRPYQQLIAKITGSLAMYPKVANDIQAIEEAVLNFLSATKPAILLLVHNTTTLPPILKEGSRGGLSRARAKDFKEHPSAAMLLDLTDNSILAPARNKTRSVLTSIKRVVKPLYQSRMYAIGAIPRRVLSAEDAARRANQYAARVLLHGDLEDGSETFPPVAGRPPVPRKTVEKFSLEPAVDAGLLTIE